MGKIKTAVNLLHRDPKKIFLAMGRNNLLNWIPDKPYLRMAYYCETGKELNLENPTTYNEKLQWIKIYDRKPEYIIYVDKIAVREHIKQTIGEEYLIPLIGIYKDVEEIPWNELPDKFVLKCTHGSGCNIICKDKSGLDIEDSKKQLKKWMEYNFYWVGREWPYKNVKPRIICEEFISDTHDTPDDYKIMCFNGKAKLIEVHMNRYSNAHTQDYYDADWNKTKISQGSSLSAKILPKPVFFAEMLRLSEVLARDKYHVRIDWYVAKGKLYFGEITFFDGSGLVQFDESTDDLMLGSWINLGKL